MNKKEVIKDAYGLINKAKNICSHILKLQQAASRLQLKVITKHYKHYADELNIAEYDSYGDSIFSFLNQAYKKIVEMSEYITEDIEKIEHNKKVKKEDEHNE